MSGDQHTSMGDLDALMHRNATSPVLFFGLPPERVIDVGTQVAM